MYFNFQNLRVENSLIGVRVDLNSPVVHGKILLNERFYRHAETLKYLISRKNKIVLFSHQGRKGKKDFMESLNQHANLLSRILGIKVKYYDGLVENDAIEFVKDLKEGEIVLMKNLRFYDFETNKEKIYNNPFIREYSEILDFYILDAFSVSHREHSSIVGFKDKIINIAGLLFDRELSETIKLKYSRNRPTIYVLGGEKVDDLIDLIVASIENRRVNKILTTGLLSILALEAAGIETNDDRVKDKKFRKIINLLSDYLNWLEIPSDVAIELNGRRKEINVYHLKNLESKIYDLGRNTIKEYSKTIKKAKTIYAKGPAGLFEDRRFAFGTKELLKSIVNNKEAYKFLGGGHIVTAYKEFFGDKGLNNGYISVSGGAVVKYLADKELPGLEALKENFSLFKNKLNF